MNWKIRALANSYDLMWRVVLAVLVHNYPDEWLLICQEAHPGFAGLKRPLIMGGAVVAVNGKIVADIMKDGMAKPAREVLFDSGAQLGDEFRKLADKLKLSDRDRIEMVRAVTNWVVADLRFDHLGRKLAS